MPSDIIPYSLSNHPAPHRERVGIPGILYGVFGSGIFWAGHLMVNYAIAVHACYPGSIPLSKADSGAGWGWPSIFAINLLTLLLIASTFAVSYRCWVRTGSEAEGHHHHLIEKGEGRTRFLGIVGMAFAVLFFFITLTDTIGVVMVPVCAR